MVSERVGVRAGRGDVVWKADCGECSQIQRQLGRPMLSTSPCWLWRCRVVFQGSVKPWIADERAATISQRLVSQFLGTIERGQLVSKLLVQSALRIPRGTTLHQINCEGG